MGTREQHQAYAAIYRLNDPHFLRDLLVEDVVLLTHDGISIYGATNVLGYLVGNGMTQWSQIITNVDAAISVGPRKTNVKYVIDNGYAKEVLFEEIITWNDDLLIETMVHTSKHRHRARTLPLPSQSQGSCDGIDYLVDTFVSSSTSSSHSSSMCQRNRTPPRFEISHASVTDLTSVKRHRSINAYLLVKEFPSGRVLHRSGVVKNSPTPQWQTPIAFECSPRFRRLDISIVHTSMVYTKQLGQVSIDASVLPSKAREQYDFMGSIVADLNCAPDLYITFHRSDICSVEEDFKIPHKSVDPLYRPKELLPQGNIALAAEPESKGFVKLEQARPQPNVDNQLIYHMLQAVSISLLCVLGMVLVEYTLIGEE
ncbi:hypothetical protein THRCLA_01582 [Thraustotheca clavata]|uniref:C2 domain-containing protein n=1 Tax=Thraustotheca clavata TaxID=74557 RepID=A0A1W0A881_9STRA|nr:hypothetical protein THRCLA_01582 [Thraustotheca clavata]